MLFALGCALLLAMAALGVALAHAELIGAEPLPNSVVPEAPERVRLFFSEPIVPQFFALEVYDAARRRVDRGDAQVSPMDVSVLEVGLRDVGPGVYTVVWRVLSLDDHVVQGTFVFGVGAGTSLEGAAMAGTTSGWSQGQAAVRWTTYLATALLAGSFAFPVFVMERSPQRARLWLAWGALGALFLASFAALLLQAASLSGTGVASALREDALNRTLATEYGLVWAGRMVMLLGLVGVLAAATVVGGVGRRLGSVGLLLVAGVTATLSLSGHAKAVPGLGWAMTALTWAHLFSMGLWIGGLVQLGVEMLAALREGTQTRAALATQLTKRFSQYAVPAVLVLLASGAVLGLVYVGGWSELMESFYGATLSTKALVVVPLLLLGAANLVVLGPRLRRAAEEGESTGGKVYVAFVAGEIALAGAVLFITAVLSQLPPARTLPPRGLLFVSTVHTASYAVQLTVDPNEVGRNTVRVAVGNHLGVPYEDVERVRVRLSAMGGRLAEREVELEPAGSGAFVAESDALALPGRWTALVSVQRGGSQEEAAFEFTVGAARSRPSFSPARVVAAVIAAPWSRAVVVLALGLLQLALGLRVARGYGLGTAVGRLALSVAAAVFVVSLIAGLRLWTPSAGQAAPGPAALESRVGPPEFRSLTNPYPPTPESLAIGAQVYRAQCQSCHGAEGRGDGPAARVLNPRPADLRVHMAAGHTDGELFYWVSRGIAGTAMPAFEGQLSEAERWHVINFIRTFAAAGE